MPRAPGHHRVVAAALRHELGGDHVRARLEVAVGGDRLQVRADPVEDVGAAAGPARTGCARPRTPPWAKSTPSASSTSTCTPAAIVYERPPIGDGGLLGHGGAVGVVDVAVAVGCAAGALGEHLLERVAVVERQRRCTARRARTSAPPSPRTRSGSASARLVDCERSTSTW